MDANRWCCGTPASSTSRNGRIEAILDVELAHIGDPMMDLAAFRMRDTVIGYGDFDTLYARYAELAGHPVDIEAIELHHIAFTLSNQLAFHAALADPPPGSDYMTNLQWCNETNLFAVEAIADAIGVELPPVELPAPERSAAAVPTAHLVQLLRNFPVSDEFAEYQQRTAFRLARHLARFDEAGRACAEADLDDLAAAARPPACNVGGGRRRTRTVRARGRGPSRRRARPAFQPPALARSSAHGPGRLGDDQAPADPALPLTDSWRFGSKGSGDGRGAGRTWK